MNTPPKITVAPGNMHEMAKTVNWLLGFAEMVLKAQGKNGIKIEFSDNNMIISLQPLPEEPAP